MIVGVMIARHVHVQCAERRQQNGDAEEHAQDER
jgi:hypothetical protein